ncbi:MAG: CapA family protein [Lawsonibacter sp.]|nr:CapA family protein [Lawsonibacter sp.]
MRGTLSFTAAGDMLVQRRMPQTYQGLEELTAFIQRGDMRYFNLETTLNHGESWGNQFAGGSWLKADPLVLEDAKRFGFNMLSFANNHTLDFSHWGLLKTIEALEASGIPHAGAGRNLGEAAAPAYFDSPGGRFALICACATFEPSAMAGEQSRRVVGRPGLNGLRHNETYVITKEEMAVVKRIAENTSINGRADIMRREGYLPPVAEGTFKLGTIDFVEGEVSKRIASCNKKDLERVKKAIYEAEFQADFVVVAVHSHELTGTQKETPDDFLVEFAHSCIDAGADAVIGTGPHILRPIEIYHGCPIFYSLGDFVLQNENIPYGPEEFYDGYGLDSDSTMRDLFIKRSNNFSRGLQTDHRAFESVIPLCRYEDGALREIVMLPIELGFGAPRSTGGLPRPMPHAPFLSRLIEMSKPYGTEIRETPDGLAAVVL